MPKVFSASERVAALQQLPHWQSARNGEAITRTFTFGDFNEAFGFMARAALVDGRAAAALDRLVAVSQAAKADELAGP